MICWSFALVLLKVVCGFLAPRLAFAMRMQLSLVEDVLGLAHALSFSAYPPSRHIEKPTSRGCRSAEAKIIRVWHALRLCQLFQQLLWRGCRAADTHPS